MNLGHQDAMRHAYWNARMTQEFGEEWAAAYATAHERVPGNDAEREAMDLYNNEVGRRIAVENPDATPSELQQLIRDAVDDGQLTVVDPNNGLVWSDELDVGAHGPHQPDLRLDGEMKGDKGANPNS
jgi:hypothetical protein